MSRMQRFCNHIRRVIEMIAPQTPQPVSMIPDFDSAHEVEIQNSSEDAFVKGVIEDFRRVHIQIDVDIHVHERKIAIATKEIDRLQKIESLSLFERTALGSEQTALKSLNGQLASLRALRLSLVLPDEVVLRKQYRAMMAIPRVLTVWVHESRIHCRTEALFGKDHRKTWRRIGPFRISFEIRNPVITTFRWVNLEGAKHIFHGPPNIAAIPGRSYGTVECPGDLGGQLVQLAASLHDYPKLLAFGVRYPECAGAVRTTTMDLWPQVPASHVPQWYLEQFGT